MVLIRDNQNGALCMLEYNFHYPLLAMLAVAGVCCSPKTSGSTMLANPSLNKAQFPKLPGTVVSLKLEAFSSSQRAKEEGGISQTHGLPRLVFIAGNNCLQLQMNLYT